MNPQAWEQTEYHANSTQQRKAKGATTVKDFFDSATRRFANIYSTRLSTPCIVTDLMHIGKNIFSQLVNLWTGNYKDLNAGLRSYTLGSTVFQAIGKACAFSGNTIPSAFGAHVPNIATERHKFIAETWFLFATMIAPTVLYNRFQRPLYYQHFVELVTIFNICLLYKLTPTDIDELEQCIVRWVEKYEKYNDFTVF